MFDNEDIYKVARMLNIRFDKYPYEFSLFVTYRTDENRLTTQYKVRNEGKNDMPFGIGSKPAFKIDLDDLEKGNYYQKKAFRAILFPYSHGGGP